MTLHDAPDTGPLATTGGAIATLTAFLLAALVLLGFLVALAHRYTTRCEQAREDHAVGNFSNVGYVREDMGVPWMNRDGIRESIPPAYGEYVARQFLAELKERAAA